MSDTISAAVTPGYQFPLDGSVPLTWELINQLATPTVDITGTVGTLSLADLSVTTAKLAANCLAASATGRGKMQDGFFAADATSRAKIAAGFFAASDATSLAFFASGFWTADATGRAKMADSYVTGPKLAATAAGLIAACRNLKAFNNTGTPNSQVDITADEVLLKDSSGKPYLASSVSLTVNIALGVALNGLETGGTESASHWYYIWLISDGTNVRSVLKDGGAAGASSGAPDLGDAAFTGYTYKALIGAVQNNGSSNFQTFYQVDRNVWISEQMVMTGQVGTGSFTSLSMSGVIPNIAKSVWGTAGTSSADGCKILVAGSSTGIGTVAVIAQNVSSSLDSFYASGYFQVPMITASTLYWNGPNDRSFRITLGGYSL